MKRWLINDLHGNIPAHIAERLSVIALQHLREIRAWSRSIVSENQTTLDEMFVRSKDVECLAPGFGSVIFSRLRRGQMGEFYDRLVRRYQTSIAPGHFRLGLGGKPEVFREGLKNLCRALDEFSST